MTADEYWDGPGIRFLNEDGTLPTVEERVKAGYDHGWVNGMVTAMHLEDRKEIENQLFGHALAKAGRLLRERNQG